jgi:predicted lipoprotein with Yx(FWY)xxD motif
MTSRRTTTPRTKEHTMQNILPAGSAARITILLATATLATLAFLLLAPAQGQAARGKPPRISTAKTKLGRVLVDGRGRTLYLFEKDRNGMSACAGSCATYWPPLLATGRPAAGADVNPGLLGKTTRADGVQVTYHRHPLYTFSLDTRRGETKGQDVTAFGGTWYVVSPSGGAVEDAAAASGGYGG